MFSRSPKFNQREALLPLAEAIADAFEQIGDTDAANSVLSLAARHGISDSLALRQAEQALASGDAHRALDALIPAWEAGSPDLHLEVQMGLASLALGLYDVVETLTDQDEMSDGHLVLRWILAIWDDLPMPSLDLTRKDTVWLIRSQLMTLARCGRTDLVYAVQGSHALESAPHLRENIAGIPAKAPAPGRPGLVPVDVRSPFKELWSQPAPDAVFSWVYSSARQVFEEEKTAVMTAETAGPALLLTHGETHLDDSIYRHDASRLAPAQFHHVVSLFDLNRGLDPTGVMAEYARSLTHEGQLHLLAAGPRLAGEYDLTFSMVAIERLCKAAGLISLGVDARDDTGMPVPAEQASVLLLRAEKRIV